MHWNGGSATQEYSYYLKFEMKEDFLNSVIASNTSQLPESLDQVNLIAQNMERLNQFVTGNTGEEPSGEILAQLKFSYLVAKDNHKLTPYGTGFTFDTGLKTQHGESITASIKPGTGAWSGTWGLNYVGYDSIYTQKYFNSSLMEFADLDGKYLTDLSELAKDEKWYFDEENGKFDILQNYIAYTFYHIKLENKLCINRTNDFAAFNTGLASASYEDIYMCFSRKSSDENQKWKYAGVCTEKGGSMWKKLIASFSPLPEPAQYFTRKEDILFDINKTIYTDDEHIIRDRLHRIPTAFLRLSFQGDNSGIELLNKIDNREDIDISYTKLREIIDDDADIFNDLCGRLEQLVNKTARILRWNYRLAIPCYYPQGNTMSLLLPLDFTDCGTAQAALVVQMTESGNYIGHTLLNLRHAYLNARLISSQESSWLTA